jgi:hypothetical protein
MKAYAILITNDHLYWNKSKRQGTIDEQFHSKEEQCFLLCKMDLQFIFGIGNCFIYKFDTRFVNLSFPQFALIHYHQFSIFTPLSKAVYNKPFFAETKLIRLFALSDGLENPVETTAVNLHFLV